MDEGLNNYQKSWYPLESTSVLRWLERPSISLKINLGWNCISTIPITAWCGTEKKLDSNAMFYRAYCGFSIFGNGLQMGLAYSQPTPEAYEEAAFLKQRSLKGESDAG